MPVLVKKGNFIGLHKITKYKMIKYRQSIRLKNRKSVLVTRRSRFNVNT